MCDIVYCTIYVLGIVRSRWTTKDLDKTWWIIQQDLLLFTEMPFGLVCIIAGHVRTAHV